MDYLALAHKADVLVIPFRADDVVLGLSLFNTPKPDIDSATGQLTSLSTPSGQGEATPDIDIL
jgi:hypothetical protein